MRTCPVTNAQLKNSQYVPNYALKTAIEQASEDRRRKQVQLGDYGRTDVFEFHSICTNFMNILRDTRMQLNKFQDFP